MKANALRLAAAAVALSGCISTTADFATLRPGQTPGGGEIRTVERSSMPVTGRHCGRALLSMIPLPPTFSTYGDKDAAVEKAIESAGTSYDVLTDATLNYDYWSILLFSSACWTAEGFPAKNASRPIYSR